jgi:hypothetical protein
LFRNDGSSDNHWVSFRLKGVDSNPEGIGAWIRVTAAGRTESRMVKSATGYCSQNQLAVTVGLGTATRIDRVDIDWPSGTKTTLDPPDVDQLHVVVER